MVSRDTYLQGLNSTPSIRDMEKEVNCENLRPGDETKPFWVVKCCTNSEELQQKPKAERVSKKETAEPDWIRSLILTCITFNLNNAYVMLKIRAVTPSDYGVISDSYLKSSAHCAVASKKKSQQNAVNHLEGYCERARCCSATSQTPCMPPSCTQSWPREGCSS